MMKTGILVVLLGISVMASGCNGSGAGKGPAPKGGCAALIKIMR